MTGINEVENWSLAEGAESSLASRGQSILTLGIGTASWNQSAGSEKAFNVKRSEAKRAIIYTANALQRNAGENFPTDLFPAFID